MRVEPVRISRSICFTPLACFILRFILRFFHWFIIRFVLRGILGFGLQQCFIISAETFYFSGGEVEAVQAVEDVGNTSGEPAVEIEAAQVFKRGGRKSSIHGNA